MISFKQRLDYYLSCSIPDLPCSPGYNNSLDGGGDGHFVIDDLVAG